MRFDTLTIVGVGLIGASAGLAARERRAVGRVVGVGRSLETLETAKARGALDEYTTDLEVAVRSSDLVLVCTPVDRVISLIRSSAAVARPGTVFTDAGSTKAVIARELDGTLPAGVPFVGGHPLAGSEKRGPDHARADLFAGRLTVLTPTPTTDAKAVERVAAFWRALGSTVKLMDPREHDETLAVTSHLPHLVAAALAGCLPDDLREFAATGFRDTTRVAAGDPELWAAIFAQNKEAVRRAVSAFRDRLTDLSAAIYADDAVALRDMLTHAKKVRDDLGN